MRTQINKILDKIAEGLDSLRIVIVNSGSTFLMVLLSPILLAIIFFLLVIKVLKYLSNKLIDFIEFLVELIGDCLKYLKNLVLIILDEVYFYLKKWSEISKILKENVFDFSQKLSSIITYLYENIKDSSVTFASKYHKTDNKLYVDIPKNGFLWFLWGALTIIAVVIMFTPLILTICYFWNIYIPIISNYSFLFSYLLYLLPLFHRFIRTKADSNVTWEVKTENNFKWYHGLSILLIFMLVFGGYPIYKYWDKKNIVIETISDNLDRPKENDTTAKREIKRNVIIPKDTTKNTPVFRDTVHIVSKGEKLINIVKLYKMYGVNSKQIAQLNNLTPICLQYHKSIKCKKEEHSHEKKCRKSNGKLKCNKSEHIHNNQKCYVEDKSKCQNLSYDLIKPQEGLVLKIEKSPNKGATVERGNPKRKANALPRPQ